MKIQKKSTVLHNIFLVITHSSLAFLGYHATIGSAQADFQRNNHPVCIDLYQHEAQSETANINFTMPADTQCFTKHEHLNND